MTGIKCCLNCTDRYVGCHSSCEKYKAERAELDRLKEQARGNEEFRRYKQESISKRVIKKQKRDQEKRRGHHRRSYG